MGKQKNIAKEAKIINIIVAGLIFAAGLMLLIIKDPPVYQKWMFGALFIVIAGAKLIGYFSNDLYRLAFQFDLTLGIFAGVIGILFLITPEMSPEVAKKLIPSAIGFYVILDGSLKLQTAFDARRFGMTKWLIILITSILICGVGIFSEISIFLKDIENYLILAIAVMAEGCENAFVTAYTVRLRSHKKDFTDKYDLTGK